MQSGCSCALLVLTQQVTWELVVVGGYSGGLDGWEGSRDELTSKMRSQEGPVCRAAAHMPSECG
jgi:hypothetical protein